MMSALQKIKTDLINICSYDGDWFLNDYRYYHKKNETDYVDLIVFSEKHQRNLDTACIAIGDYNKRKTFLDIFELARRFALTTAPYSFIIIDNFVRFYLNSEIDNPILEDECAINEFTQKLITNKTKYEPGRLILQKKSFGSQLQLFAVSATRESLVAAFEEAEANAIKHFNISESEEEKNKFLNLIFQVFAAKVLEDKRIISGKAHDVKELLINAHNKFKRYFNFKTFENREWEIADFVFSKFDQHKLIFDCVTNEMLGFFYENLFVERKTRKLLQIHYTPPRIAKELVARIPFENIHPDKLHVLDASSGSGTLLIASCQRIKEILPVNLSKEERHDYITNRIHGIDIDQHSGELAKVQLLLNNLPNGNSWDIKKYDFLEVKSLDFQPTVIIANPPYREDPRAKGRFELAAKFFEKCSDFLFEGGYIGILLPASFRDKNTCQKLRKNLIENFDILELWDIPRHIFKYSDTTANILIAQKIKRNLSFPIRSRYVHHDSRNDYLKSGKINYSYLQNAEDLLFEEKKLIIVNHPMQNILKQIMQRCRFTIGKISEVFNGIQPGKEGREKCLAKDLNTLIAQWGNEEFDFWLNGALNCLEPFNISWETQKDEKYIYYLPSLLRTPCERHEDDFRKPGKIILNTNRPPDSGWRIYGAIDEGINGKGFFPSNGLYCIKPKSNISVEEIVAIINSPISNIYIDYLTRKQQFSIKNVESIPFPNFSEEDRSQIISIVQSIMRLKKSNSNQLEKIQNFIVQLDKLIFDAYGISIDEKQEILTFLGGNKMRPGREWEFSYLNEEKDVSERPEFSDQEFDFQRYQKSKIITGSTIDVVGDKIRLFLIGVNGFDYEDETWISIPPEMPGWALRPGVSFEVYLESDLISNIDFEKDKDFSLPLWGFKPLTTNYMTDEELLKNF
ncbi:MAG: N-6 DNA methylase [Candidatus Hodarchaeota archaeon]